MPAEVNISFSKKFSINPNNLTELESTLRSRLFRGETLEYIVSRGDRFILRTMNIQEVLTEKNDSSKNIESITILVESSSKPDIYIIIEFDHEKGASAYIKGDDKDMVTLIYDDLYRTIGKEIANLLAPSIKDWEVKVIWNSLPLFLLLFVLYANYERTVPGNNVDKEAALLSDDALVKLDYLISATSVATKLTYVIPVLAIGVMILISGIPRFLPGNEFMIGDGYGRKKWRSRVWQNIIWVIVIGFIVNISAGVALDLFSIQGCSPPSPSP